MSARDDENITIRKAGLKLTPPGYHVVLSEEQSQLIAEFVDSPVFKTLRDVFVRQRLDHIARRNLNYAQTVDDVKYHQGMANELVLFFKTLKEVKEKYIKRTEAEMSENEKNIKK